MAADQLSKNPPDGTILGQSATDKVAFFGGTPAIQSSGNAQAVIARGLACGSIATIAGTQTPAGILTITTKGLSFTVQSGTGGTWLVTGTNPSDVLIVNKPTAQAGLGIGNVRVSANNTAGVSFMNPTAATITPTAAEKYGIVAIRGLPVLTASLSPAIVASNTTAEQTFTVTGLRVGELVQVMKPSDQDGLTIVGCRVAGANSLGITFANPTAAAITPSAAETYTVLGLGGLDAVNNEVYCGLNVGATAALTGSAVSSAGFTMTGLAVSDAIRGVMKPTGQNNVALVGFFISAASVLGLSFSCPIAAVTPTASEVYGVHLHRPNAAAPMVLLTASLSPAAVASLTCAEQGFTVTGLVSGSMVWVNKPSAQAGLGIAGCRVSGTNALAINFSNTSTTAITPTAAETYLVGSFQMPVGDAGTTWVQSASMVQQNTSLLANAMRAQMVATNFIPGA